MFAEKEELLTDTLVSIPTAELSCENIADVVGGELLSAVVVASVVPAAAALIKKCFNELCPVILLDAARAASRVCFDYPGVHTLGADRIANVIAAAQHYPLPCVAVDAGTAITFDVLLPGKDKPCFVGGAISPGVSTMLASLSKGTALLPSVQVSAPAQPIGTTTQEAIQAGVYWGACGMVDEILQQIEKTLQASPYAIATGGDAALLASGCKKINIIDEFLTFRGLWHVACDNL